MPCSSSNRSAISTRQPQLYTPAFRRIIEPTPSARPSIDRQIGNLRGLLVLAGLLEERDTLIVDFEQAASELIEEIDSRDDRDLLRLFLRWHVIRRLNDHANKGTLTPAICAAARQRLRVSIHFAEWAAQQGTGLTDASQRQLDQWLAEGTTNRRHVAALITWLRTTKRNTGLKMPTFAPSTGDELTQAGRLKLLSRYFTDTATPIDVRVAGLLYLLLAMPIARIVTLTRD